MSIVPQELVDTIVSELEDVASLKACSLAGSAFRSPSQRILLRSLTLEPTNYRAFSIFLEESPHVATYIICLHVHLPSSRSTSEEDEFFIQVLSRPANVRRCIVHGDLIYDWTRLTPRMVSAVLGFLVQQPLRELRVLDLGHIPLLAFSRLLSAAPTVSFHRASVTESLEDISAVFPPDVSFLTRLGACRGVCKVLARPQFAAYTATLRHLEIQITSGDDRYAHVLSIICSAAHTLTDLQFACEGGIALPDDPSLPQLPVLRRVEFVVDFTQSTHWFNHTILAILAPKVAPALAEIVVTLQLFKFSFLPLQGLESDLMHALESALLTHSASPSVTWNSKPLMKTLYSLH